MDGKPTPDPDDWRTWERDGIRLFPPPGATPAQAIAATSAFSGARWGIDPDRPSRSGRNLIRKLEKVDGRYVQVWFKYLTPRGPVDVKVYGGCRYIQAQAR